MTDPERRYPYYFWCNNQIVEHLITNVPDTFRELFCVDTHYYMNSRSRYGKFLMGGGWTHIPLEDFPPEFRLQLLILGVS